MKAHAELSIVARVALLCFEKLVNLKFPEWCQDEGCNNLQSFLWKRK